MRNTAVRTVLVACFAFCALAQFNPSKPAAKPVKSDIKYIKCQVCELLAKNAYRQVNDMKKAVKPNKKVVVLSARCQASSQVTQFIEVVPSCAARGDGSNRTDGAYY